MNTADRKTYCPACLSDDPIISSLHYRCQKCNKVWKRKNQLFPISEATDLMDYEPRTADADKVQDALNEVIEEVIYLRKEVKILSDGLNGMGIHPFPTN